MMLDLAMLSSLASSAVGLLTPLLNMAFQKGAEELGKSSAGALVENLKQKIKHAETKEALEDLISQPDDTAAQGAMTMQLRKALASDPDLVAFLNQWVADSKPVAGISQTANVHGNDNKVNQIAGSGISTG